MDIAQGMSKNICKCCTTGKGTREETQESQNLNKKNHIATLLGGHGSDE